MVILREGVDRQFPIDGGVEHLLAQRNPANSAAGSSVKPSDLTVTSGKPSRPGRPTNRPVLSYVHAWYGQVNRFALPHPLTTWDCRCRQTFSNALTDPSDVLVSRIDRPITSWCSRRRGR